MKTRPILFSAPMVRALLAGRKTQTRRAFKPGRPVAPTAKLDGLAQVDGKMFARFHTPWADVVKAMGWRENPAPSWSVETTAVRCPYGIPGDRLWVREAWGYRGSTWCNSKPDELGLFIHYQADDSRRTVTLPVPVGERPKGTPKFRCGKDCDRDPGGIHGDELTRYWRSWRPSIHMPRWASRITLEVIEVRVQRLQDISAEDAWAEGMDRTSIVYPTDQYADLWDAINGPGSWKANPWVWVITFRRGVLL